MAIVGVLVLVVLAVVTAWELVEPHIMVVQFLEKEVYMYVFVYHALWNNISYMIALSPSLLSLLFSLSSLSLSLSIPQSISRVIAISLTL